MPDVPDSWKKQAGLRIYRMLLRLFPADFLEEYEYWMVQTFRDQMMESSSWTGKMLLWARTILDLAWNGIEERMKRVSMKSFGMNSRWLWILGFAASMPVLFHLSSTYFQFLWTFQQNPVANFLLTPFMQSVAVGVLIGGFQWLFVRKFVRFHWMWPLATCLGYSLGKTVGYAISDTILSDILRLAELGTLLSSEQSYMLAVIPVYVVFSGEAFLLAIAQLPLLSSKRFRWAWIPISLVAWLANAGIIHYIFDMQDLFGPTFMLLGNIMRNFMTGLILAVGLRFLLSSSANTSGENSQEKRLLSDA